MKDRVTVEDVAKEAGVCRTTVYRYLNGKGSLRPESAQRIRDVVERLGYRENRAAKVLASRQHVRIAFIGFGNADREYYIREILAGVRSADERYHDYGLNVDVFLAPFEHPSEQARIIRDCAEKPYDGLVIMPNFGPEIRDAVRRARDAGMRIVTVNRDLDPLLRQAYYGCDYRQSGRIMGDLLGRMDDNGQYLVVMNDEEIPEQGPAEEWRLLGIRERLEETGRGSVFKVLRYAFRSKDVQDAVLDCLRSHPEISGIVDITCNLEAIIEANQAVDGHRRIAGFDLYDQIVPHFADESIEFVVTQDLYFEGFAAIRGMYEWAAENRKPDHGQPPMRLAVVTREVLPYYMEQQHHGLSY